MTAEELQAFEEANWARVPEETRARCVAHLRKAIPPDQLEKLGELLADGKLPPGFHMFGGMSIRNALREVVYDDELPDVEYPGGEKFRNWDDFYMAAVREAVR